ncbi:hypothetical protein KQI63_05850 [bacterium]|nr:hypothetical protein [bacterium]
MGKRTLLDSIRDFFARVAKTKTFATASTLIVTAAGAYATGGVTLAQAATTALGGLVAIALRDAQAKSEQVKASNDNILLEAIQRSGPTPESALITIDQALKYGQVGDTLKERLIYLAATQYLPILLNELAATEDVEALGRQWRDTIDAFGAGQFGKESWDAMREQVFIRMRALVIGLSEGLND